MFASAWESALRFVLPVHVVVLTLAAVTGAPGVDVVRGWTEPWEKALGVHQTWPMFVNPPRATVLMHVVALYADGSEVEVPILEPNPALDGTLWLYSRASKFERNAVEKKRNYLRAAVTRWVCREVARGGDRPVRVAFRRESVTTPPPFRPRGPRSAWPASHDELETWRCR